MNSSDNTANQRRVALRCMADELARTGKQSWMTLQGYQPSIERKRSVASDYATFKGIVDQFAKLASEFHVRPFYRDEEADFTLASQLFHDACTARSKWF